MTHKSLVVLGILVSTVASAAGPAKPSLDGFFKDHSTRTGRSEENLRREAIEVLRSRNLYSEAQLARIGRGAKLDPYVENGVISLLAASRLFRAKVAIAAVRNETLQAELAKEFESYKENSYQPSHSLALEQMSSPHSGVRIAQARALVSSKLPGSDALLLAGMKTEGLTNQAMAGKVHDACVNALARLARGNAELQLALLHRFAEETHFETALGITSALVKSAPADPAVVEQIVIAYLGTDPRISITGNAVIRTKGLYGAMTSAVKLTAHSRAEAGLIESIYHHFDDVAMTTLAANGINRRNMDAFLHALRKGNPTVRSEAARLLKQAGIALK